MNKPFQRFARLLLLGLMVAATMSATVKVNHQPATVTQSDGTQLTVLAYGDEHQHHYTTTDGVLLVHQGTDFFVAQIDRAGQLTASPLLAHECAMRSPAEQQLADSQNRALYFSQARKRPRRAPGVQDFNPGMPLFPATGSPKVLVVLAQFSDVKFIDADPVPVFHQYFNYDKIDREIGNGTARRNFGSVRKYYRDMSFGQFDPQFDVVGPVTLGHSLAYYGRDDKDTVDVDFHNLIPDVCELAARQGVRFTDYDNDGDGTVDLVYIIYAGYSQSWTGNSTDCIWPKTGHVACGPYNGAMVLKYSVNSELNAFPGAFANNEQRINGVGLSCHEFGHCLGLPDIYPTDDAARQAHQPTMEYWDLMDGGEYVMNGYYPTELTAWEREALGWMTIDTLTTTGQHTLPPLSSDSRKAYRLPNYKDPTHGEYLLLQTVKDTLWNKYQQGAGMLMMLVDYDANAFSLRRNAVNNEVGHPRFTLIPADGEIISQYAVDETTVTTADYRENHLGDPYPGSHGVTDIAQVMMYTGPMELQMRNIHILDNGSVSFEFDKSTAISNCQQEETAAPLYGIDGRLYHQQGRDLPHGIYIMGKKKVVVR